MPITGSMGMILVPAASGVGAVLLAVTQQNRPLLAAAGLLVLAASIIVGVLMVIGSRTGDRRRIREQRERYLDYLERIRQEARDALRRQQLSAILSHPPPDTAASAANSATRRWERRPGDADFMKLRIGTGGVPPARPLTLGFRIDDPLISFDGVCLAAAKTLAGQYTQLADQPICLPLGDAATVSIRGERCVARAVARALLAQLVWAHSPGDVGIAVICDRPAEDWGWLKWLPHNMSRMAGDGPLGLRLITESIDRGAALLQAEAEFGSISHSQPDRRLVIVIDLVDPKSAPAGDLASLRSSAESQGTVFLHLLRQEQAEPELVDIRVTANEDGAGSIEWPTAGFATTHCSLDWLNLAETVVLAKSFAPLRPANDGSHTVEARSAMDSVRFSDVATLDPAVTWRKRGNTDLMRVPIGVSADGSLLVVDLKESAAGGMGPHGLVVGATGSGKSELLRTLVTTLTIGHPPEALALLLADFKGGSTFSGLATLPHIAGMVTNLEADLGLVDRFRDALSGELQRRQEILAAAGKVSSLDAYQLLRLDRPDLPPLSRLLVIVDEFSELLSAKPDLAELFVAIGRIGRSIGIHLLLATQRLDTGRIRGLESHLSYRICLRTFSEAESREAIGTPAAYRLPTEPGWAYLQADTAEPVRFRAATVSRPYRPTRQSRASTPPRILPFTVENRFTERLVDLQGRSIFDANAGPNGRGASWQQQQPSVLDVVVERLTACATTHPRGRPVRPVWLEPLPGRLELGRLLDSQLGAFPTPPDGPIDALTRPDKSPSVEPPAQELVARLGLVDIPEKQLQEILGWDFDEGNGNLLIVGTGRSGKSTAVCTLLCALAATHPPGEIEILCADFGGESLSAYRDLPHVAAVATRSDPELTRLMFSRVQRMLTERELLFRQNRFDSAAAARRARVAGSLDPAVPGAVVLIIDGWAGLRDADPSVEAAVEDVLGRGPGLGVHTVLTVSGTGQLRTRLAAGFSGRIELRLADAFESTIDRHLAKALPADRPGRAVVAGRHFAQIAQPLSARRGSQRQLVEQIQRQWPGPGVAKINTLPEVIRLAEIRHPPIAVAAGHRAVASGVLARGSGVDGHTVGEAGRSVRAGAGIVEAGRAGQPPLLLGVSEHDMSPVQHSLTGANPHLLIYGDTGSGKTALLRSLVHQLLSGVSGEPSVAGGPTADVPAGTTPEVLAIDYRRGLPAAAGTYQRFTRASEVPAVCAAVAGVMTARLSDAADSAASSAELYLVVDDYELVSSTMGNPLAPLLPFLPHARDIAFHLIIARRSGGAARAQYEPLLQSLGDLGTPVLLLSGAAAEGRLGHGLVPQPLPPGRAQFAIRGVVPRIIQIGWVEPGTQLNDVDRA